MAVHARVLACALALACANACASTSRRAERVIVVSVDGLMPATYLEPDRLGLRVPTLRALARDGLVARAGATSVFPSITYPAHTTIATGVRPARHGVTTNVVPDALGANQAGWRWYVEDSRVPTVWQRAKDAGLTVALVHWPVTVGARVDALVPEYWRAGTSEDVKLMRALATPGLLEEVAARFPGFWDRYTPPETPDDVSIDIAVHVLETRRPQLLMVHIWQTDNAQHDHGPGSPQARAAIEHADRQIGRLVEAAQRTGRWERTGLLVVSDHGFAPIDREIRPAVLLRDRGLASFSPEGKPTGARVFVVPCGGLAYVYLTDPSDEAARREAWDAFAAEAARPEPPIARLFGPEEIEARGGDPAAAFALEAGAGHAFTGGVAGPLVAPTAKRGVHGYPPDSDAMRASLMFAGGIVRASPPVDAALVDVAPTVAAWLGIALPGVEGRVVAPVPAP